jgi:hypothetical protein
MAYLERRGRECKEIIVAGRKEKAMREEERKRGKIEDLERIRNETAPEQISKHKNELAERKREH